MSVKSASETAEKQAATDGPNIFLTGTLVARPRSMRIADYERNARVWPFCRLCRGAFWPLYPPGRAAPSAFHLSHAALTSLAPTFSVRGVKFAGDSDMEIV